MIALDTRCRDILLMLLDTHVPLAASDMAAHLDITPRMVRYSLRKIEKWLETEHVRLVARPGAGIYVDAPEQTRQKLAGQLETLTGYPLLFSSTERLHTLTLLLLTATEPVQVKQLQRYLGVSRTTVLKDLDQVEVWLQERRLQLVKRPNFGCQVQGGESERREAIVAFLEESVGETRLLVMCFGSRLVKTSKRGNIGFERALATYLETAQLTYAKRLVALAEKATGTRFVDRTSVSLVLHLSVLIRRAQEGKSLDAFPEHLASLKERHEFYVAELLAGQVEERFHLRLGEAERIFIASQLLKAETRRAIRRVSGTPTTHPEVSVEVLQIVNEMVAQASLYLHPYLRLDEDLIRSLGTHLTRVFDQLRLGMPIHNPLLEDIKKQYPHVFKAAQESGRLLGNALGWRVSESEIGYITLYLVAALERLRPPAGARHKVLVVCSAGVATAYLLASRMRAEFPEVEIVDVISTLELQNRRHFDDVDLIVSTIPVQIDHRDIPAVLVSPFLDSQDLARLKRAMETQETPRPGLGEPSDEALITLSLADLLTDATVGVGYQLRTWQAVVGKAGGLLVNSGAVEARYVEAMKDVVVEYGPYMVAWPGVALLHARPEDGVRRVCMSLITLAEPVAFGHAKNDPVDIAIALGACDGRSYLPALLQLYNCLIDKQAVGMIRRAIFKSEILYLVARADKPKGETEE